MPATALARGEGLDYLAMGFSAGIDTETCLMSNSSAASFPERFGQARPGRRLWRLALAAAMQRTTYSYTYTRSAFARRQGHVLDQSAPRPPAPAPSRRGVEGGQAKIGHGTGSMHPGAEMRTRSFIPRWHRQHPFSPGPAWPPPAWLPQ